MPPRRPATLLDCALPAWPPSLLALSFDTRLVPLPPDVAAWLGDDGGVWLPDDSAAMPKRAAAAVDDDEEWSSSSSAATASDAAPPPPPSSLPAVTAAINDAIAALGGTVLPKLDWSAPLDAAWLRPAGAGGKGIACGHADEVLLLLKASDRVAHDVGEWERVKREEAGGRSPSPAPASAAAPTLALRRWHALRPEAEFRLFVAGGVLTAACQRDVGQHFAGLAARRRALLPLLTRFVSSRLDPALPHLTDYVADVYVHESGKVRLVDVAPAGGATQPLLFGWGEVGFGGGGGGGDDDDGANDGAASDASSAFTATDDEADGAAAGGRPARCVRFRVVTAPGAVAPGARALYGAPHDMVATECTDDLVERLRRVGGEE